MTIFILRRKGQNLAMEKSAGGCRKDQKDGRNAKRRTYIETKHRKKMRRKVGFNRRSLHQKQGQIFQLWNIPNRKRKDGMKVMQKWLTLVGEKRHTPTHTKLTGKDGGDSRSA